MSGIIPDIFLKRLERIVRLQHDTKGALNETGAWMFKRLIANEFAQLDRMGKGAEALAIIASDPAKPKRRLAKRRK